MAAPASADQEAVQLLSEYLRIDTTNPPGNEFRAAHFFKAIFDREGIESRIVESAPGRASIVARLTGNGGKKDVVLLNHMDVVPAEKSFWKVNPFSGAIQDGYIWARGAIDMKGVAIVELTAMLALKRSGTPLAGDVVFVATADEEAGGEMGAGYLVREHFDLIKNAGTVINEGGVIVDRNEGAPLWYSVGVAEKTPLWLKLTATGTPGHGSTPPATTAVTKIIDAVVKLRAWQTPLKVTPLVQKFYANTARVAATATLQRGELNLAESLANDPAFRTEFLASPGRAALVRNTVAITMLEGSSKINVIPPRASGQIDVRLLPGEEPASFVQSVKDMIGDPSVAVESGVSFPASSSG